MNRTLKVLDKTKWYHIETLTKFYSGRTKQVVKQKDRNGKEFSFVIFKHLWNDATFLVHPKTQRLKLLSNETFEEVGYDE